MIVQFVGQRTVERMLSQSKFGLIIQYFVGGAISLSRTA